MMVRKSLTSFNKNLIFSFSDRNCLIGLKISLSNRLNALGAFMSHPRPTVLQGLIEENLSFYILQYRIDRWGLTIDGAVCNIEVRWMSSAWCHNMWLLNRSLSLNWVGRTMLKRWFTTTWHSGYLRVKLPNYAIINNHFLWEDGHLQENIQVIELSVNMDLNSLASNLLETKLKRIAGLLFLVFTVTIEGLIRS